MQCRAPRGALPGGFRAAELDTRRRLPHPAGGRDPGRGKIIADTGRLADEAPSRSIPAKHAALAAVILAQLATRGDWALLSELTYTPRVGAADTLHLLIRRGYVELALESPPHGRAVYRYRITPASRAALAAA